MDLKENEWVFDPNAEVSGRRERVFKSLEDAVDAARSNGVVYVKCPKDAPVVEVRPVPWIDRGEVNVTFKPYRGCQPVLALKETDWEDAALFYVRDARLQFENLQFHLRPTKDGYKTHGVVAMVGNGQCAFKNCVITLEEAEKVRPDVVAVVVPKGVMKGPLPGKGPQVQFQDCFIRGQGDAVTVFRPGQPINLDAKNSLVALAGSFLKVDNASVAPGVVPEFETEVKLTNVTAYLTRHLVHLRAGRAGSGLVGARVTAQDCLFAAAAKESLVHLDAWPESETRNKLAWEGGRNVYGNFEKMLDQQPPEENVMAPTPVDQATWREFAGDKEVPVFLKVKFELPPLTERPLVQALPEQFRLKPDKRESHKYGVNLDELTKELPEPVSVKEAGPESSGEE